MCNAQGGVNGSCVTILECKSLVHLVSNLTRPIRPELPSLMRHSLLCDDDNVGGLNIPKVCCPLDNLQGEKTSEEEIPNELSTTTKEPSKDEER